ncbi:serine threonine protein kinase [Lentinula edodes]|uniref:Serine threonine protein kinase n=1 Tax=Lentinula edodes TaxID=5353 RepID=A0A1Q3EJU3_LENED|nr:serine threonine protein kinase [Lentinula edodes]
MTSYRDLLGSLKDEPSKLSSLSSPPDLSSKSTSSPDNPKPKLHRPSASAASDLRLKYQTLSRHADEASNYDMRVMAAAISSSVQSATPQLPSIESSLQNFQTEITKQTVKSMLSASAAVPSIEENSLESLLVADRLGRLQFGDPRKRNTKVMRALMSVSSLHDAASDLKTRLDDLSRTQTTAEIQSILCAVEDGSETLRREIASSTAAVSVKAKEVRGVLDSIEQSVQLWRREYPDTAPVKIDNRKCFFDPGQDKNSPTIIAYCIALVARVFERTAQRGATFILKMIKIFGYTLATLGGRNLNTDQEIALAEIPESIERLEKKFNLDVDCVPYAVCPKCSKTYAPSFPNGASHPVYPPICLERQTPSEEPCSTSLLSYGKPAKIFEYYPFFDWFGKFISLPGIEEYGDKFCEAVESHQNVPNKKVDQTDGCFVHEFPGADAQLFIVDRGSEGRWLFTLNADFFNAEGNRIRGKKSSTDYEEWKSADDAFLRKGAELWRDAPDIKKRKILEDIFGTRASEFWRLPYWKASIQLGIDPMHTMFLILLQRYFRDILGLDNPDDPKRTPKKPKFKFAFYYDFTPPPPLSSLVNQEDATRLRTSIIGYDSQPIDDNLLSLLEWPHLSMEHSAYRWARLQSLQVQVANDSRAQQAVLDILNDLSERAPTTEAQRHQLYSRIQRHKWSAILYVCDNLAIFPNASGPDLRNSSQITQKDVTKRELSNILLHWRTNEIKEEYSFIWPFFTPSDIPPPIIPWATHHASIPDQDNHPTYRKFSPGERLSLLKELAASMSYHSASHVGNLHRLLQKPMAQDHKDDLRKALKQSNADALAYVCADIERLPVNKFNKDHLVDQLMTWRMSKPLEQMPSIELDSSGLLHRIQQVIREAVTPAWVTNPPPNVGLAQAGTLKAEHWRTLFSIHVPLAVLSLWKEHSPSASPDASSMTSLVDTTMYLACASIVMAKRTLSVERRNLYRHLLRLHILGLKQDFPGWIFPTHHLAFHIFDGMNNFSGVRNWWLFPFENLIGKLQRIPTNHIAGQFEHTMLHSFCKGASFRQWLLRENSPPILKYCQQLLDKAYNYDRGSSTPPPPVAQDDDIDESEVLTTVNAELVASNFVQPDSKYKILPSPTLTRMLGTEPFECFSRIPGSKGDYTIPGKGAIGNSNVCFQAQGNYRPGQRWLAGQIRHIFRQTKSSPIQVGICRSMPTSTPHPFSDYWANGFEADIVASKFSNSLEIINFSQIAGHSARWSISDDLVVVVNLCSD